MSQQSVTSKYFISKNDMEESLLDFQDEKKCCVGPKKSKSNVKKIKPKKRIRGQKDIRTLVKYKTSELYKYANDFNNICKETGVDIDSEQLQLAVALSKSLHENENIEAENSQSTKKLTSQERVNKICTTLQQYGFQITQAQIEKNAKPKIYRKPYKLLQITEKERQQKILDKYSQVLFENLNQSFEEDTEKKNKPVQRLYHMTTSVLYESIKNNELLYSSGILKNVSNKPYNLLRDWADIPGRPVSPKLIHEVDVCIRDLELCQRDLDILLSGSFKAAKQIVKSKINIKTIFSQDTTDNNFTDVELSTISRNCLKEYMDYKTILGQNHLDTENKTGLRVDICKSKFLNNQNYTPEMYTLKENRCTSPDIFGEELSSLTRSVVEDSEQSMNSIAISFLNNDHKNIEDLNEEKENCQFSLKSNQTKQSLTNFMDLTKCISMASQKYIPNSQLSQKTNMSSESMEITKCVHAVVQTNEMNIDLTQDSDDNLDDNTLKNHEKSLGKKKIFNLTQSSNSDEELPFVEIHTQKNKSLDKTIMMNYSDCCNTHTNITDVNYKFHVVKASIKTPPHKDLIPEVNIEKYDSQNLIDDSSCENTSPYGNKDNDIVLSSDDSCNFNIDIRTRELNNTKICGIYKFENIELTRCLATDVKSVNVPKIVDLVNDHGNNISNDSCGTLSVNDYENLGKVDNISIDYDAMYLDNKTNKDHLKSEFDDLKIKYGTPFEDNKTIKSPEENSKFEFIPNLSNLSQEFDLSDKELYYSLHRTKTSNINMGGISICDNFIDEPNINKTPNKSNIKRYNNTLNRSMSESSLPVDHIEKIDEDETRNKSKAYLRLSKSNSSTPIKAIIKDDKICVQTPTNSEYIVKTEEVTPIINYEAMTTPERNNELAKYGLKPFKRKRAIQLLTHLYHQTHPIIESYSSESPSKKIKYDVLNKSQNLPRKLNKSPKKTKELHEVIGTVRENSIYLETKDVPDVRDIECNVEDWIFMKKEKAKIHSCQMPLHIAFHNYVSCRQGLREAILRYEPVHIDIIHKDLVSYGYRYNPKDLLKFMDKKCITVKTVDNNARNVKVKGK